MEEGCCLPIGHLASMKIAILYGINRHSIKLVMANSIINSISI